MNSIFRRGTLFALLFALGACRAEPQPAALQFPKETEGVNHEAQYRIVIKGNVININSLNLEARKSTVRDVAPLNNGKSVQQGFFDAYYNNYGVSFFVVPYKEGISGESLPKSEYPKWLIFGINVYLQQTEQTEKRDKCTKDELGSHLEWIDKFNQNVEKLNFPEEMLITIRNTPCEKRFHIMRPSHPYSGYLEVDGLALPVGRKISFAEIQGRRKALGLPLLTRQPTDEQGIEYSGHTGEPANGQTWIFDWFPNSEDPQDRKGTARYLKSICVGSC